jgi:integrase
MASERFTQIEADAYRRVIKRHERPLRRVNPSGRVVFVARYTNLDGKRVSAGTFALKRDAQDAIDDAYKAQHAPEGTVTVDSYFDGWLARHPRSARTDVCYEQRVRYVLDVQLDRRPLRDWPLIDVKRRQAVDLLDHMLRVQGRAVNGARGILRVLSAMWQDAADDGHEIAANPFMGVKLRKNDRRVQKPERIIHVWSWEQMRAFCAAAALPVSHDPMRLPVELRESMVERWAAMDAWRALYAEPMLRVLSDCGVRLGELLPLERGDVFLGAGRCGDQRCVMSGPHLHVRRTAWNGVVESGTKTDHGEAYAGRSVPLGASVAGLLDGMPRRIDTRLLFPSVGGGLFSDRNFRRDVWEPARVRVPSMVEATPHGFRHSYVSLMRAAGVNPAALAAWTGHTVLTATMTYTHDVGGGEDEGRAATG